MALTPLVVWDPRYEARDCHRQSLVQMIDWMPTLLQYFKVSIPQDVEGTPMDQIIRQDTASREYALYGTFSGHVNITDGDYAYMRAPVPGMENEVYNYTLMPTHMNERFSPEELKTAQLVPPFSFTKGCPHLKIKSRDKYKVARFGTRLYDLKNDPREETPIQDPLVETRMVDAMAESMRRNDCPPEQFERLGLN